MICKRCQKAGRQNQAGRWPQAFAEHTRCPVYQTGAASSCDCQHETGEGWINDNGAESLREEAVS